MERNTDKGIYRIFFTLKNLSIMHNISIIFLQGRETLKIRGVSCRNLAIIPLALLFLSTISGCGGASGSSNTVSGGSSAMTGSVTLAWDAPVTNTDGSELNDLAGYKVYYGTSSTNYTQSVDIGNFTDTVINDLPSGTWCFAITAYNSLGNESTYSNELCKVI